MPKSKKKQDGKSKKDNNEKKTITNEQLLKLKELLQENPEKNLKTILQEAGESGLVVPDQIPSQAAVWRRIKALGGGKQETEVKNKQNKKKRKAPEVKQTPTTEEAEKELSGLKKAKHSELHMTKEEYDPDREPENKKEEKKRFVVFAGNLPFRTTEKQVKELFSSQNITTASVRMPTDKKTKKPKGFAFVEFPDAESLRKALYLHHTDFNGRRVNVELTAGGGGNSETRQKKIKAKNEALTEEREKYKAKREEEEENGGNGEVEDVVENEDEMW